jgi:hypothetical protein
MLAKIFREKYKKWLYFKTCDGDAFKFCFKASPAFEIEPKQRSLDSKL